MTLSFKLHCICTGIISIVTHCSYKISDKKYLWAQSNIDAFGKIDPAQLFWRTFCPALRAVVLARFKPLKSLHNEGIFDNVYFSLIDLTETYLKNARCMKNVTAWGWWQFGTGSQELQTGRAVDVHVEIGFATTLFLKLKNADSFMVKWILYDGSIGLFTSLGCWGICLWSFPWSPPGLIDKQCSEDVWPLQSGCTVADFQVLQKKIEMNKDRCILEKMEY